MNTKRTLLALILMSVLFYPLQADITKADFEPENTPYIVKVKKVWVTAYSSTPDQTDDTPFITASGKRVADGIVAANFLPFGTKVRIPSKFGDKVFVVQDRMHKRKTNVMDVWMENRKMAIHFGSHYTEIEILEESGTLPVPKLSLARIKK